MTTAYFGGGCFWCLEAAMHRLRGVHEVTSGYVGGATPNPTYEDVCNGTTGHAEVVDVNFDPSVISYDDLLTVFFAVHDPTTRNRQGNDVGTQYRSVIFTTTDEQLQSARAFVAQLTADAVFERPIVTEILPAPKFYPAEPYHQRYYDRNTTQGYCSVVISPKLKKLRERFAELLRDNT